jgi:hypothetical protein
MKSEVGYEQLVRRYLVEELTDFPGLGLRKRSSQIFVSTRYINHPANPTTSSEAQAMSILRGNRSTRPPSFDVTCL